MNKKTVLSIFIVSIIIAAAGELFVTEKQSVPVVTLPPIHHVPFVATTTPPQPIATTTQPSPTPPAPQPPTSPPPSRYPQSECKGSQANISTSTWKVFASPQWGITFQYPSDWKIDDSGYLAISGDDIQLIVKKMDETGFGLVPTGAAEPYYCPRIIAGQHVDVGAYFFYSKDSTLTRVASIAGAQSYGFVFSSPSSTADRTDPIFYTILDTVGFVKP